jgi:pyrroline-5-carboxylate reductase
MKILFVGGGNMAQAIIGGLLSKGAKAADLHAIEPFADTRMALSSLGVASAECFRASDLDAGIIVLAVKPQMMKAAVAPLAGKLRAQIVVSIAAGIRCGDLAGWLGDASAGYQNIVRTMPNTPALIHAGITGLYAMPGVGASDREKAESLMAAVGQAHWFDDEAMLDAVTAVSGSGPAYVFYFIEALEQAALELGFNATAARAFATTTFVGGARLAAGSSESPATLRERVTSKRGTTERAIETFDQLQLKRHFIEGVKAACARSRELGEEMGRQAAAADGSTGLSCKH